MPEGTMQLIDPVQEIPCDICGYAIGSQETMAPVGTALDVFLDPAFPVCSTCEGNMYEHEQDGLLEPLVPGISYAV